MAHMSAIPAISPFRVPRSFVIAKCDYFLGIQLWPRNSHIQAELWLSNFLDSEVEHAIHLLNGFLFFCNELTTEMFKAAFQKLSALIGPVDVPFVTSQARWAQFRRNLIATHVTGEVPNDTDSGYVFARKARQELGLSETQILSPEHVLQVLATGGPRPVLFVDDFVGSGDQFVAMWKRETKLPDGTVTSFDRLANRRGSTFFYCPIFCTELGRCAIVDQCPEVVLSPAHFLTNRYSALMPDSLVWPDHLRATAIEFIECASRRAGILNWSGYKGQGLTIAFEHGVPDATLPLYYHASSAWKPLVRRT